MVGIDNVTTISMDNITYVANFSSPTNFAVKVNWIVFDGWLFFGLLMGLWVILIAAAHKSQKARGLEPSILHNMMYSGFPLMLGSFLLRAVEINELGLRMALLTDYQLWIIPLFVIIIASVLWATKDS